MNIDNVLIDTWWNVNMSICSLVKLSPTVLIDTWWNVNFHSLDLQLRLFLVLIDTWWNVNVLVTLTFSLSLDRFNRYMVECK